MEGVNKTYHNKSYIDRSSLIPLPLNLLQRVHKLITSKGTLSPLKETKACFALVLFTMFYMIPPRPLGRSFEPLGLGCYPLVRGYNFWHLIWAWG